MRRALLLLLLASCGGEGADLAGIGETASSVHERHCPPDSILRWENFGDPFLRNWCTGCHSSDLVGTERRSAPEGIDFDTVAGARRHRERIYLRAADGWETMPPVHGPSPEDRRRLGEWLACGAP